MPLFNVTELVKLICLLWVSIWVLKTPLPNNVKQSYRNGRFVWERCVGRGEGIILNFFPLYLHSNASLHKCNFDFNPFSLLTAEPAANDKHIMFILPFIDHGQYSRPPYSHCCQFSWQPGPQLIADE